MTPQEELLRDMARHPDLFGKKLCRQMQHTADELQAQRLRSL